MWKPTPPMRVRIAERYRSRTLKSYAICKLLTDPVYDAVAARLLPSSLPLLDIGCGIGLCPFYLRERGYTAPIVGVDIDEPKVRAGQARAALDYPGVELRVQRGDDPSLFAGLPPGHVTMLDVLHYFDPAAQREILTRIAGAVAPGGWAILRVTPRGDGWRFRFTRWEERFTQVVRWMTAPPQHFPTTEEVCGPFRERGFTEEVLPLWGRTPFNSHLFAFRRPGP